MSSLAQNFLWLLAVLTLLAGCQPSAVPTPTAVPAPTATLPLGVSLATRAPATAVFTQQTATPLPTPTLAPTATPILYEIREGDTLLDIAIENNITVADITSLNPAVNPNLLTVGQQLLLPTPEGLLTAAVGEETAVSTNLQITQLRLYPLPQGSGWLLGEMLNGGEVAVEDVRLTLRLLDGTESTVWESSVWLGAPLLPAGEVAPFGALIRELPQNVQPDVVIAAGREAVTLGSRLTQFEALSLTVSADAVSGRVTNVGEQEAAQVTLLLGLYDGAGRLVGFQQQVVADALAVGEERPFVVPVAPPGGTAVLAEPLFWGTAVVGSE